MMEDLRERYFGPSFELFSHDKVNVTLFTCVVCVACHFTVINYVLFGSRESCCITMLFQYLNIHSGACHQQYSEIWDIDEKDPFVGPEGGESVKDVASRLARAMAIMDSEFEGYSFHFSLKLNKYHYKVLYYSCVFWVWHWHIPLSVQQIYFKQAAERHTLKCKCIQSFISEIMFWYFHSCSISL